MICPGVVTAMAVSPDGNYCVVAVEEKLHVWQVCSFISQHIFFFLAVTT